MWRRYQTVIINCKNDSTEYPVKKPFLFVTTEWGSGLVVAMNPARYGFKDAICAYSVAKTAIYFVVSLSIRKTNKALSARD